MTDEEQAIEARRIEAAKAAVGRPPVTKEELERRLAAAKARQAAAAERHELARELANVEAEETLAEIVERRDKLAACIVRTPAGPVVLERGSDAIWKPFYAMASAKRNVPPAEILKETRRFVVACVAYPPRIDELLSEAPAALDPLASALSELYGLRAEEDAPK